MPHPVIWFEVVGQDLDRLKQFYRDLFQWGIQDAPGGMPYAMFQPDDDQPPMGGIGVDPSGGPGHVTWYAQTDDLQASLDHAESLGGRTVLPPTEPMQGTAIALFADPEGHVVGLVKPGPPPDAASG
jgi:predicted enzyme related to lactoylglutathione lyase